MEAAVKHFFNRGTAAALAVCFLLLLSGCGAAAPNPAASGERSRVKVVATDFPAYDFARAVCGTEADAELLLPPGTESHSYEPTPRDILDVGGCDLFIYVGGESDAWVDTILQSLDHPVKTLKMTQCVELLPEETAPGMTSREERSQGESAELDEHVWTSPANAALIVEAVGQAMEKLDPEHAAAYRENAGGYAAQIRQLDEAFKTFFSGVKNPTMVFGDRFPLRYFAQEYGITCYAAFPGCSAQTEPSAATVAFLTDKVRTEKLSTVYYIEFSNHLVADSIAEAAGVGTALFHSCHNVSREDLDSGATYVSLMRGNLETLKKTMR
jgi:zinc transport system substrate-binding protein